MTVLPKPTIQEWNMKVRLTKLNTTMCPAVIETKSLTIKETGLVRTPISSTGNMIGLNHQGTPGVQKMCDQ